MKPPEIPNAEQGSGEKKQRIEEKSRLWKQHRGQSYDFDFKILSLGFFLVRLEAEGRLGNVIVDAGSGSRTITKGMRSGKSGKSVKNRILPPLEGKKLIRIDFDFPEEFAETPGYVDVKADMENIGTG